MDIESLKRELAYNNTVMQSCYGDPNKAELYRTAQSRSYELMKALEQFNRPMGNHVYNNGYVQPVYNQPTYNNSYNQRPSMQTGFQPSYTQNSYDNTQTGVNLNNTRYANKSNPNTNITPVVVEQPEPVKEVEKTPYPGNEYPFLTDKYTISKRTSIDGIHYQYEISKVKDYDRSIEPLPAKKIENIKSIELKDIDLEDVLLTNNLNDEVSYLENIIKIPISKTYTRDDKIKLENFKLTDTPEILPYDDNLVKPIDRFLTRLYNLKLGTNCIFMDCDNVRLDMGELNRLAASNQVKGLGGAHYDILEEIDNWIENNLTISIEEIKNDEEDKVYEAISYVNVPSVFINTQLALDIKVKHPKTKHLYVSKQSYKMLFNVMNGLIDRDILFGMMFYRSNTGGIGYFLFAKSNYNTYILSI